MHLRAAASDSARIYQAGGDQHIAEQGDVHLHYEDGVRYARRVGSGATVEECPYPGLAAFGAQQARWFFGREGLTAELTARLDDRLRTGGPLVVVAPSGAGKSSLLSAGLLPAITRGALPTAGSSQWPCVLLTPTAHPLLSLAVHLAPLLGVDLDALAEVLETGQTAFTGLVSKALDAMPCDGDDNDVRLVIVIDQLEELFTLCADDRERHGFLDLVTSLTRVRPGGERPVALVVYGLRSDFYTACTGYPQLRAVLQDGQVLVGPMSEAGLREAILFPARAVGLHVEPGLVELLLSDLRQVTSDHSAGEVPGVREAASYEAGRLPLLAHALRATWQQRHGHTLTVDGYRATGGIHHAVATTADRLFAGLDPAGQRAAQTMFLRLVRIGDEAQDTRRRVPHADLLDAGARSGSTAAVVDVFTQGRLLTRSRDTVEITHEALLHAWPRLCHWIDIDRADSLTRQKLEEAAAVWERSHRDSSTVYRGSLLAEARDWSALSHEGETSSTASRFLAASIQQERRGAWLRRVVISTLSALVVIASGTAVVAVQQRASARAQRDIATASQIISEADRLRTTDPALSAQLDIAAYRLRPSPDLYTQLVADTNVPQSTALGSTSSVAGSVAFSPDRRTFATADVGPGNSGTVQLWDIRDLAHPLPLGQPLVTSLAVTSMVFSPDGQTLAAASDGDQLGGAVNGAVQLLDLHNLTRPGLLGRPLSTPIDGSVVLAFSPDGHTLVDGGPGPGNSHSTMQLWDLDDLAQPVPIGNPMAISSVAVTSVSFSPDGHTLAEAAYGGTVQLWDFHDRTRPTRLGQPLASIQGGATSAVFSPDGHILTDASAGAISGGAVQVWDIRDPTEPRLLDQLPTVSGTSADWVVFSTAKQIMATVDASGTVQLWDTSDPRQPTLLGEPLIDPNGSVRSMVFGPDGRTLAGIASNGTVQLWRIPDTVLNGRTGGVTAMAYSPDGHTLADSTIGIDGDGGGTVQLWDVRNSGEPKPLGQPLAASVTSLAFSPDGHTLAAAGGIAGSSGVVGPALLWDVRDPTHPVLLGRPFGINGDEIRSMAFSPDSHTLAIAGFSNTIQLWDVANPANPVPLGDPLDTHAQAVTAVAFSPDGKTLTAATAGPDLEGSVQLWDIGDRHHPRLLGQPLGSQTASVTAVAFSPDGNTLGSAVDREADGAGGKIQLWTVRDRSRPARLGQPLTENNGPIGSVAFSLDGSTLVSVTGDTTGGSTVRMWDVRDLSHPAALGQPLSITGATNSDGVTGVAFSSDGSTFATLSGGVVRLWGMDANQDIQRICAATRNALTVQQWHQHVPEAPFNPPCR